MVFALYRYNNFKIKKMKVLVIGGGNMGLTYAEGMSASPYLRNHKLRIFDSDPKKITTLRENTKLEVFENLGEALTTSDIIFIVVKPFHSEELFQDMKPYINSNQVFVSLMAGVTIGKIQDQLGIKKVIRAMPNLPAKVGKGVTSFTQSDEVSRIELLTVRNFIDTTGESIHVETEREIDASTGISGSGPAYVFYFMQSMLEASLKMGFSEHDSKILVSNTFEGAIEIFNQSNNSPTQWMDMVASKGGTTRAALDSMEDNNVKELIKDAAFAAFDRAVELGNK